MNRLKKKKKKDEENKEEEEKKKNNNNNDDDLFAIAFRPDLGPLLASCRMGTGSKVTGARRKSFGPY
jgi:hypothetical protein